jgi:hypothetical protein
LRLIRQHHQILDKIVIDRNMSRSQTQFKRLTIYNPYSYAPKIWDKVHFHPN